MAFTTCHLAGWRECTTILCGTSPTGGGGDRYASWFGVIYVLLYFASIMIVPILVLAAGFVAAAEWWQQKTKK